MHLADEYLDEITPPKLNRQSQGKDRLKRFLPFAHVPGCCIARARAGMLRAIEPQRHGQFNRAYAND